MYGFVGGVVSLFWFIGFLFKFSGIIVGDWIRFVGTSKGLLGMVAKLIIQLTNRAQLIFDRGYCVTSTEVTTEVRDFDAILNWTTKKFALGG